MIVSKRTAPSMSGLLIIHPAASWVIKMDEDITGMIMKSSVYTTAADTGNRQEAQMCKITRPLISLLRASYWLRYVSGPCWRWKMTEIGHDKGCRVRRMGKERHKMQDLLIYLVVRRTSVDLPSLQHVTLLWPNADTMILYQRYSEVFPMPMLFTWRLET